MKIAYLARDLDVKTGGGRYASDLIGGIEQLGHPVIVLTHGKRGLGIIFSVMKTIFLARGCDVIHALDGNPYAVIAALANVVLRKKFIVTVQGSYGIAPLYNLKTRWLIRWAYRRADVVIAISSYTKKLFQEVVNRDVIVIGHGVNLENFYRQHLPSGDRFLLGVGALKERKGYHISLAAFAQIAQEFPAVKYYIVGDKDKVYADHLNILIQDKKIKDRVVFFERISDEKLSELYQKASIFILTPVNSDRNHFEGFGLVYLEAAAAGLPVIGTEGNGAEDAVWNGENGILVPQQNIDATAHALKKILSDDSLAERMSQKSYQWAREHDLPLVIKKYDQVYLNSL